MIFRWIQHTTLKPFERLMMVLFEMGMATLEDLSIVMGYTEDRIFRMYKQIRNELSKDVVNKLKLELKEIELSALSMVEKSDQMKEIKKKIKEERSQWAKVHRQNVDHRGSSSRLYSLGWKGVEYCMSIMHEKGKWDIKDSQKNHYNGVNKILTRAIRVFGSHSLKWYYTYEATDVLIRTWEVIKKNEWSANPVLARKEKKEMIRPDALCVLADRYPYWIEFDNDTERFRQLTEKLRSYQNALSPKLAENVNYPVIWVTTSTHRRDELSKLWEMVKDEFYKGQNTPAMQFFVQGEETKWWIQKHRELMS